MGMEQTWGIRTSGNSIAVEIPGSHAVLPPHCGYDGSKKGSGGVNCLRNDPRDSNSTPVGEPLAVLLALANQVKVAEDTLRDRDETHDDGKDTALGRDLDGGVSDGLRNSSPGRDGWDKEGTVLNLLVDDARVGAGEENEKAGSQPHRAKGANGLSDELLDGGGAKQKPSTEIADKSVGDISTTSSKTGSSQIELLGVCDAEATSLGSGTKDELRSLGGGGKGSGIGDGANLDGKEGEEEGKQAGEDGQARMHLPLEMEDDNGNNDSDNQAENPHPVLDLLIGAGGILDLITRLDAGGTVLGEEGVGLALGNQLLVDGGTRLVPNGLETVANDLVLHKEFSHGGAHHDHDTGPEQPIPGRRRLLAEVPERVERVVRIPLGVVGVELLADALAVVHKERANEGPGAQRTDEHGDGGIETDQDTGTNEGRRPFKEPAP